MEVRPDISRSSASSCKLRNRSNRSTFSLGIPIYADPARQLKNLPPIVPFKETQGKSWLVNPSLTPRTKALSHGHDMASQAAPEWCHHPPATAEISLRFGR
ncbi:Uncharacterized protein HZ326_31880, partial [Fusarium oxysporum f. sp. albedinis]